MNLLWRDNFESFLDASAPDAFVSAPGPDAGLFSGQSLLWTGNSPSALAPTDVNTVSLGGFDAETATLPSIGSGLTGQDVLWTNAGYGTAIWPLADSFGDAGTTRLGIPDLPLAVGSMPSDGGSLLWDTMLSLRSERISALANSGILDSALTQVLDLAWTAAGGTGAPPFALPPSPLADSPPTNEWLPDGTGTPPVTPPVTPPIVSDSLPINVMPEWAFADLAPQQLVWTDPSQGVPTTLTEPPGTGVTPLNALFGRS